MGKIEYRLTSITHLMDGGNVVDSYTMVKFEEFNQAVDYVNGITKIIVDSDPYKSTKWIFEPTYAKCLIIYNNNPFITLEINPIHYHDGYADYRYMKFVRDDNNEFKIIFVDNDGKDTPITKKNSEEECIMYADQFSVTTNPYLTDETTGGRKSWMSSQGQILRSKKSTQNLVS